jgi:hypothetical protein
MAILPRQLLKSFFEKGDKPTQTHFSALIDSLLHRTEDNAHMGFRAYDPTRFYLTGDAAIYEGIIYEALSNTTGTFTPASWKVIIPTAADIPYEGSSNGLSSEDVQNAIDTLVSLVIVNKGKISELFSSSEFLKNKGAALGYAGLDADGKISTNNLPQSVLGATKFKGFWDAENNIITSSDVALNTKAIPVASSSNEGWYFIVSASALRTIDSVTEWALGDWIISMGTEWKKVDNTDALISWNGRTGAVLPQSGDYTPSMVGLANVPNVDATDRANHTGTQTAATISDFQAEVSVNTDILAHTASLAAIDITRRHDFVSSYSYCGKAPSGSAEASPVWTITRIQVSAAGTATIATASNVAWTDRLTTTYS